MTTSGRVTTYRYVSDGALVTVINKEGMARLRHPAPVVGLVLGGTAVGIVSSFRTNEASLPDYLGRVLLIGVAWGLAFVLLTGLMIAVLVVPLASAANRHHVLRRFPLGSVTEVDVGDDALVIRRPAGTSEVPYRKILNLRPRGSFLNIAIRNRLIGELLPLGLLPDDAVEFIRTRSRGAWPAAAVPDAGTPTRRFVVPPGWATHVASVHTRAVLGQRRFWTRMGLVLLGSALVAYVTAPWLLLVSPALAIFVVVGSYVQTRRLFTTLLPTGSVATTEFLDDHFVSRNAGGVREIPFADISSIRVRGDLVQLGVKSQPGWTMIARALVPDEAIAHLREQTLSRRRPAGG